MKGKWACRPCAHLLIRTLPPKYYANMTPRLPDGNQRSLDCMQGNPYFSVTPDHRNGHTVVQPVTPVTSPIATPICSGFSFWNHALSVVR